MNIVSITPIQSGLMTDKQFKLFRKHLKKNASRSSTLKEAVDWLVENNFQDVRANIEHLVGLGGTDCFHIIHGVTTAEWIEDLEEDPNQYMTDREWKKYIDNVLYEATDGKSVPGVNIEAMLQEEADNEEYVNTALHRMQEYNIEISIDNIQRELWLMSVPKLDEEEIRDILAEGESLNWLRKQKAVAVIP